MEPEPVQIIRTTNLDTNKRIWVIFDKTHIMRGGPKDSKADVKLRWVAHYGMPTAWELYEGIARPSEFAMTVAEYQNPVEKKHGNKM